MPEHLREIVTQMKRGAEPFLRPITLCLVFLTLSGLYLAIPASHSMGVRVTLLLLLHLVLGWLCLLPLCISVWRRVREKNLSSHFIGSFVLSGGLCLWGAVVLLVRPLLGQSNTQAGLSLQMHLYGGILFTLLFLSSLRPTKASSATTMLSKSLAGFAFLAIPFGFWAGADQMLYDAGEYLRDLGATNREQAENPLFPASLRLAQEANTAQQRWQAQDSAYCTREGCHAEVGRQWHGSAHALAGSDPFYQRVLHSYEVQQGKSATLWCQSCHEPERAIGSQSALAQGVDCITCHATTTPAPNTGNGRFTLAVPENYPFDSAKTGWQRSLHEYLLRLRPQAHQFHLSKPLLKRSELCGSCHRQSYGVAQNHYRFYRTSDSFGEWRKSRFANGLPSEAGGKQEKSCQTCHWQSEQGHSSHGSLGGNTALAALQEDKRHLTETQGYLKRSGLEIDIFAMRRQESGHEGEWIAPLNEPLQGLFPRQGEAVLLDVVIENQNIGHDFPSGYADLKAIWLEVTLVDSKGSVLLWNGVAQEGEATPPPNSHQWNHVGLDRAGTPIIRNNRSEEITTLSHRAIPSGGSTVARYSLTLPKTGQGGLSLNAPLRLHARLLHQSLRPEFAKWVLGNTPQAKNLPITVLAESSVEIPTGSPSLNLKETPDRLSERLLRYGKALLAPEENPELQGAVRAFRMAKSLSREKASVSLALGQAFLREPALLEARSQFREALQRDPNLVEAQIGYGTVLERQGQFQEALQQLLPLSQKFPNSVELWSELGRVYYQQGDYAHGAEAFQKALTLEPDDPKLHFRLKQCYQHLQRVADARREESIGRYHRERRWEATIAREYLRLNPKMQSQTRAIPVLPLFGK